MSDTETFDAPTADAAEAERLPRPRIRTGAVIWGLLLTALGAWVLWIAATPARRADALDAVLGLDVFGWTVIVLVLVGGTLTAIALAAVIRRAQHRSARTD
jgi:hypothetical protein